ncbi:MAG: DMT family transporter [Motiliproteus sp.]
MPFHLTNWILLLCLVFLWGTSFVVTAISVESITPIGIVALRVLLGALVLVAALRLKRLTLPRERIAWGVFLLMGMVGNLLPFFLIAWGQQSITSGMAGVIMAIMPLATMILAHYFVAGENLNRFKLLGFGVGIGGIILLLGPVFGGERHEVLGAIAVLVAACSYALNTVLAHQLPSYSPLMTGAGVLIASSLVAVPIWLYQSGAVALLLRAPGDVFSLLDGVRVDSLVALIWLGIGPTGIATLIYFNVIQRAGPSFLSTINYLIPAVAFFTGALVLNEPVTVQNLLALGLVLLGIALTRYRTASAATAAN